MKVVNHSSTRLFIAFLFVLMASTASGLGRDPLGVDLPDVPAPDGASWYWVGKNMAYNGLPMSVKMFEYAGGEDDIQDFYKNYWRVEGHGQTGIKDFGLYKILTHNLRGFYTSVQFRYENGFIKGKIVVTESPEKRRMSRKTSLPVPRGGEVSSKVESRDGDRDSETITIESNKRVDFNKSYYENQLDYRGWKLVYATGDRDSQIQHYQKGSELLQITIKKITGIDKNRSQILLHWIK